MKQAMLLLLVLSSLVSGIGCGKSKKSQAAAPVPVAPVVVPPPAPTSPGSGGLKANEVPLTLEGGRARLGEMFFQEPVNNPQNIRLGLELYPEGNAFGGEIYIRFEDNGQLREAVLSTSHPFNGGVSDASKNIWFDFAGKTVWHGFFQDRFGAVVVVIDQMLLTGDGRPSEYVGGSVWFQNFGFTNAIQGPNQVCWNISIGPFDCRTFIVGNSVVTTSAVYPNNHGTESIPARPAYKRLGTFTGLHRRSVFNN